MDSIDKKTRSKTVRNKDSDYLLKVIGVQVLVCSLMVLLIIGVCRFSSDSGESLKNKYKQLMISDISFSEVWSSVKEVAEFVMKPVDTDNIKETVEQEKTDVIDEEEYYSQAETTTQVTETTAKAKTETIAVMSLFEDNKKIVTPVHGRITSYFGERADPISGDDGFHKAVDIAVDEGTRVAAAWDGIVTKEGYDATAGNYVWMVHKNGKETLYCHCSQILVNKGTVIRAGETIAFSGNTGYSTGPHLHFAVKDNGEYTDPLNYLKVKDGKL